MTPLRSTAAAVCGLAAAALAFLVTTLGGRAEPHYSHVSQFISELGATGAANADAVAAGGFAPIGVLVLSFLALASSALPRSRRTAAGLMCLAAVGVAYLVAAVFPCDAGCPAEGSSSQAVHNLFGFFEYVGVITGLLILASAWRRSPSWRNAALVSVMAAFAVAIGLVAMLTPSLGGMRGISQRIAETGIFGWVGYLSVVLWQGSPATNGSGARRGQVALGVVLALVFALWELPFAAFMADDYVQVGILERASQITWIGPLELYTISDGKPDHINWLKDLGAMPWWFDPGFKMAFFRPLSSASLALDHALFGLNPLGYRIHVALWVVALAGAVGLLYGRVLSPAVGKLAMVIFVLSGTQAIFCWSATRHIAIAAAIGTAMLYAHVCWREAGWRFGRALSLIGCVVAFAVSEAALGLVAYVLAYELLGAGGDRRSRVRASLPYIVLVVLYGVLYRSFDLGVSGGSGYLDPSSGLLRYLVQIPGRVIFIVGAMILGGNADVWVLRPDFRPALVAGAVCVTLLGALLLRIVWKVSAAEEHRAIRWLLAGSVLAAIPFAGSPIGSRCVVVPWIGGAAAVALVVHVWWTRLRHAPGVTYRIVSAAGWVLAAIHLVFAPLQRLVLPWALERTMAVELAQAVDQPTLGTDGLPGRDVIILNAPDFRIGLHAYFFRQMYGLPMPERWRVLSWAPGAHRFRRLAPDTVELELLGPGIAAPHLVAGDVVNIAGMTATIVAADRNGPTRVTFRFARSLDDPAMIWLGWKDGRLRPIKLPPVGGTLDL